MSDIVEIAILLMMLFAGYALGWAYGTNWQLKRDLPELRELREEVARLKLLARMQGVDRG